MRRSRASWSEAMLHFSWRAKQDLVFGIGMFAACALRSAAHPAPQTGAGKRFAFTYPPFKSCHIKQKEPRWSSFCLARQAGFGFRHRYVRFLRSARRSSPLRLKPGRVNASRLLYPPFKSCYTNKQKEPPMVAFLFGAPSRI